MAEKLLNDYKVTLEAPISSGSKIIGKGAWSVVYEVKVNGSPCAAKKLYDTVRDDSTLENFVTECQLLSRLRHPNIVQFIGVTQIIQSNRDLALVMERLSTDLERFIAMYRQGNGSGIPLPIKLHILKNVSSGLMHLHSESLVHGSISGFAVLLTEDLQAKLTAFGRTQNFKQPGYLLHCPGTSDYMPPEALQSRPRYNDKLDCFSFGHLALYLVNEEYPTPIGTGPQLTRRMKWVGKLGVVHPLYGLVWNCLQDPAAKRPDMVSINHTLTRLAHLYPRTLLAVVQLQHGQNQGQGEGGKLLQFVKSLEIDTKVKSGQIHTIRRGSDDSSTRTSSGGRDILALKHSLAEAVNKIDELEKHKATLEAKCADIKRSNATLVDRLQESSTTVQSLKNRVAQLEEDNQRLKKAEFQQSWSSSSERPEWIIEKEEIKIISSIGRGSYADVSIALFRGTKVAAKRLHSVIISDYNFTIFKREMRIASMIRHPNLVQFIGAIVDDGLIILMELMQTSLNNKLKKGTKFSKVQILSIAIDCAGALNYLHLRKPRAIVHRDVSSPNILLEPIGTTWKAKISDLGTANVIDCIGNRTQSYGNPNYISPEGHLAHLQSPEMDSYSLGVVLMEITLCLSPDPSERDQQLESLGKWPSMKYLVQDCLAREPDMRPSMATILHRLRNF